MKNYTALYKRKDGSYVVEDSGILRHIPNEGVWKDEWKNIEEYEKEHPDEFSEEPVPPEPTLEELRASKLSEINSAYDKTMSSVVATYPDMEVLTFDKQEQEARAWLVDNSASTPLIDALAQGRGIDKAELVQRIIAKADAFALATGYLTGQRQRYEDTLKAAKTIEAVEAIIPQYSMPGA